MTAKSPSPSPLPRSSGMSDIRISFYKNVVSKWITDKNASILVVGGGETDWNVFHTLGFTNVVISNLDSRLRGDEFVPYSWSFQKAEELSYGNSEFDFVLIHAALHHCESPHRALLEMYRVAKIGIMAFESRDSLLMNFLEKIDLTPSYEHVAVYYNDGKFGGVNNTEIPNYIYRWTEREIEKTISSYAPFAKHQFLYQYGNDIPSAAILEKKSFSKKLIISVSRPFYQVFTILFPRQQNLFAFYVGKPNIPDDLHCWLKLEEKEVKFNYPWAQEKYK
jgi:ubiquinone/menaquinone biosynthesis C-methylase UbiE